MSENNAPSGGKTGFFGGLSDLGWPVFMLDEILEHAPKVATGLKEGKWETVLKGALLLIAALLLSPVWIFFFLPAWLVGFKLGFGLTAGLKAGLVGEGLLAAWIAKRAFYNPNQRALIQARLERAHDQTLTPGQLAKRVRDALAEDERAKKRADDVVRHLLLKESGQRRRGLFGFRVRFRRPEWLGWERDHRLDCFKPSRPPKINLGRRRRVRPGVINSNDFK